MDSEVGGSAQVVASPSHLNHLVVHGSLASRNDPTVTAEFSSSDEEEDNEEAGPLDPGRCRLVNI
jgi:hypothetical protein